MILRVILLFVAFSSLQPLLLADDAPQHTTYLAWHNKCLTSETEVIDKQIKKFEAQVKQNPKDYLAKAYLGSACALRAKHSFWGPTKLSFLKRGKKLIESAITAAPKDLRVRMVRAIAYSKVPKRFHLNETAISDFKKLITATKSGKTTLAVNERQAILYYAYLTFKEAELPNATQTKKMCHQLNPNSKYGKLTK